MTDEHKEILIAKLLDSPASLSDEELDAIAHDDELRDLYGVSSAVSDAYACRSEWDVEAEWVRFRSRFCRKPSVMQWSMRVAVALLGVAFISGIVAVIVTMSTDNGPLMAGMPQSASSVAVHDSAPALADTITLNREAETPPVKRKMRRLNVAPRACVVQSDQVHPEREEVQGEQIDVDEYLRIQQARIDNDLAVQSADVYHEEYRAMLWMLDIDGEEREAMNEMIKRVTMQ